jgi:hypothetical protein
MVNFNKDNKPNALETMRTCCWLQPIPKQQKQQSRGKHRSTMDYG